MNEFDSGTEVITSFRNPLIKRIRRLKQKKYRQKEGAFFVEGLRVVLAAIETETLIDTLLYCPELLQSEVGLEAIQDQISLGVPAVQVQKEVFQSISSRENPVGVGAVVPIIWRQIDDWLVDKGDIYVGLDRVSEPGNLGTVCRTLDAVGGAGMVLIGNSVDPYHPTAVKASMGTLFSVPVAKVARIKTLLDWANRNSVSVVASSSRAERSYWEASYDLPLLLLIGSEKTGLGQEILEKADISVQIPMGGSATSLNLAVAAGLMLFEIRRNYFID